MLDDFDVLVYGGTAGGVISAVTAARQGLRVALLEPGAHLGGMVTGGLSATDHGEKQTIGGSSLEFYERLGRHYGREIEWYPEPHAAEKTFQVSGYCFSCSFNYTWYIRHNKTLHTFNTYYS